MDVYLEYMENSQNSALKNKQKKKKKNHVGKWAKDMHSYFTKEYIQTAGNCIKNAQYC